MLPKIHTCITHNNQPILITAEVSLTRGKYGIKILGLPGSAVKESWARIFTSFRNMQMYPPPKKVVINLAPAHIRKIGSHFDVPIAAGILAAAGMIKLDLLNQYVLGGELSLDGSIREVRNMKNYVDIAKKHGCKGVILAGVDAQKMDGIEILAVSHFREVIQILNEESVNPLIISRPAPISSAPAAKIDKADFAHVKGQKEAKRALEIAVAGGHSVCMIGPPGSGKTMLATCIPSILPELSTQEQNDLTGIYSQAGKPTPVDRPFIAPHHRVSLRALVGGGKNKLNRAIDLAHHGVLFLDELTEFSSDALQALGDVLDRSSSTLLLAAFNPCPCGYAHHPHKTCRCSPSQIQRYQQRIPRSLMDRMDIQIQLDPVPYLDIIQPELGESSADLRERVSHARDLQILRLHSYPDLYSNGMIPSSLIQTLCPIDKHGKAVLKLGMKEGQLSARAFNSVLKVARTIADLAGKEEITPEHVAEAVQYRILKH